MKLYSTLLCVCLVLICVDFSVSHAQGLKGLGKPGLGLGSKASAKVLALESKVLERINDLRQQKALPHLAMDNRLRNFARLEAEMAARGDAAAAKIGDRIKLRGMAPYGHYMKYVPAADAAAIVKGLLADAGMSAALLGDFAKAGIGAFWVPAEKPYFQALVIVTKVPDPMAGKPGLARGQTDPVMAAATPQIKACYDAALADNPNAGGKVLVRIEIGSEGTVTQARWLSPMRAPSFDACALDVIHGLRFPKPYKGKSVVLQHPMIFSPPHGKRRIGRLSRVDIESTFRGAQFAFTKCYERRLKKKPQLAGQLTVSLAVRPDGKVSRVRIPNPFDKPLALCLHKKIAELRFPRPQFGGVVDVTYPLSFAPPEDS